MDALVQRRVARGTSAGYGELCPIDPLEQGGLGEEPRVELNRTGAGPTGSVTCRRCHLVRPEESGAAAGLIGGRPASMTSGPDSQ